MKWLLMAGLLLPAPAAAQIMPQVSTDAATSENFEYLANQFQKLTNKVTTDQVCFRGDGTCQATAASGGDMIRNAANEMGASGSITLANGSYLAVNKNDGLALNLSGNEVAWAKSFDPATESSGCIVLVTMYNGPGTDGATTAFARFTSTTTANINMSATNDIGPARPGVLLESCAPGSFCRIQMRGIARIQVTETNYSPTGSVQINFSGTRCKGTASGVAPLSTIVGHFMSTTDANGNTWMSVGL